jgi:hypothetical protein
MKGGAGVGSSGHLRRHAGVTVMMKIGLLDDALNEVARRKGMDR